MWLFVMITINIIDLGDIHIYDFKICLRWQFESLEEY